MEIVDLGLREAYIAAGEELRGAMVVAGIAERHPPDSPHRRWADRELRVLLGEYRDQHVRRGPPAQRAENAELLLNFLESLGLEPSFTDYRAAIVAHRRAGNAGRAAELVERVVRAPVTEPGRWFSLVQLLTEAGQLDRASALLAEIARGEHARGARPAPRRRPAAPDRDRARAPARARAGTRSRSPAERWTGSVASARRPSGRSSASAATLVGALARRAGWPAPAVYRPPRPGDRDRRPRLRRDGGPGWPTSPGRPRSSRSCSSSPADVQSLETSDLVRFGAFVFGAPALVYLVNRAEIAREVAKEALAASHAAELRLEAERQRIEAAGELSSRPTPRRSGTARGSRRWPRRSPSP